MAEKTYIKRKQDNLNRAEEICEFGDVESEFEEDENLYGYCSDNKQYFRCLSCNFFVVFELSQSGLFTNLYVAYKFALTIPCTQDTCERVFSKLKIVKNRLRSTLSQYLMFNLFKNVERGLFYNLDKDVIIDEVARTSEELAKKLLG